MSELRDQFLQVSAVLKAEDCAECARLQQQGGGRCPECDDAFKLDLRDAPADDQLVNLRKLQSAFTKLELGQWSASQFVTEVIYIIGRVNRAVEVLSTFMSRATNLSPQEKRSIKGMYDVLEDTRSMLVDCTITAQTGDIAGTRQHVDAVRFAMLDIHARGKVAETPAGQNGVKHDQTTGGVVGGD